jgi:hypothetical protein
MDNLTTERTDVLQTSLSNLAGPVLVTTSAVEDLAGLVSALEAGAADDVSVLTDEEMARGVRNTFLIASRVVDLVEAGTLEIRVGSPESPFSTVLLGTATVRSVAAIGDGAVTELRAEADGDFVETAREEFRDRWADAESLTVRTPPYSRMLESLGERLGESMRDDIERLFEVSAGPRGGRDVRPVRASLLVGAKNEVQFYELGLWGESEGVASRAKFSREKQTLEEAGLLETEKVPTDVGRPRQRLVLPASLEGSDPLELVNAARDALSG